MDFDLDTLQLVFTIRAVQLVHAADQIVLEEEEAMMERLFPRADLVARGLTDAKTGRPTPAFETAYVEACRRLPVALSTEQKAGLIGRCREAAEADGRTHLREQQVLRDIAVSLGI